MHLYYISMLRKAAAILLLAVFCASALPSHVSAKGRLRVVYDLPEQEEILAARIIYQSEVAEEVAQIVDEWNLLDEDVTIRFGTQIGPHFTVLTNGDLEIQIPYEFFIRMLNLFSSASYVAQSSPEYSALNTLHHAIYHELGHAIIYSQETGITEEVEEDAVDNLAAIMLIGAYADGANIAASAAKAFQLLASEPDNILNRQNDIRRTLEVNCLIYGSNPKKYAGLLEDLPVNSDALCPARFDKYHKQWEHILRTPLPD